MLNRNWILAALPIILFGLSDAFANDDKSSASTENVGSPTRLVVSPPAIQLEGPRSAQQLLITGEYGDGSVRDLTRAVEFRSSHADIAGVNASGLITASANGAAQISAQLGDIQAMVEVQVTQIDQLQPVHFHREVVAGLTRAGCNSGACHGTPSGKNGFRLSLQGYLPEQDYQVLTRELFGRRLNRLDPDESLILLKGAARIKHEGGRRFGPDQDAYRVVRQWIAEGTHPSPTKSAPLVRLEVTPGKRVLRNEAQTQQVIVTAHFQDQSKRDVTSLVSFSTSDPSVADVSKNGLVTFRDKGSVAVLCRYLHLVDNAKLTYLRDTPGFAWSNPPAHNEVDQHVYAKLQELQILPSELSADEEFVRRVHLDVLGMLPSSERVKAFLADSSPNKRSQLINEVLARPEYADYWAMKWADVLRSTRKIVSYRGAHNYRRYLVAVFAENRPFDRFVTELLTSTGDTAVVPAANFYRVARDPQDCAETTAQLFMGVRMQCAKCHNHPFERWTQDDYYGLAACFARVGHKKPKPDAEKEVIFIAGSGEVNHLRTGKVMPPRAPGSDPLSQDVDRRLALAQWLTDAKNPFFPRSVVNRAWYHLMGRGIVEPVDDFRDSNPPRIEALLDHLAKEFVAKGYDFKHILRLILNSRTYQLSARPNATNASDEKYFSRAYARILPAEVLLDAISSATGVPEKFPGLPLGTRAVELPDGEINHEFLQAFGQPTRELACECARESETTLTQALNLINGDVVHAKLKSPDNRVHRLLTASAEDSAIVEDLYLATLSRPASAEELATAKRHIERVGDRTRGLEDLHWALINCKEFLFRH